MPLTLLHPPARILAQLIADLGLGSIPSATSVGAWPVYTSNEPNTPDNVISTYRTTDVIDGRASNTGEVIRYQGVQVRVRARSYAVADVRTEAIFKALTETVYRRAVTVESTTYNVSSVRPTSGPVELKARNKPVSEHTVFVANFVLTLTEEL